MSVNYHPRQAPFSMVSYDKVTNSSAHAKFAFPKANRFPTLSALCPKVQYDMPDQKKKRGAGIGYGGREVFKGRDGKLFLLINTFIL